MIINEIDVIKRSVLFSHLYHVPVTFQEVNIIKCNEIWLLNAIANHDTKVLFVK